MACNADSWQGGNSTNNTTQAGKEKGEPAAGVNEQWMNAQRLWRGKHAGGLFASQCAVFPEMICDVPKSHRPQQSIPGGKCATKIV